MGRKTAKHSNRQNKTKRKQLKYKKSRRGGGKTPRGSRLNPNHGKSIEQQPQMKNKGPTHNFLVGGPPPIIKKGTMKSKKKSGSQSLKPLEQLLDIEKQVSANQSNYYKHLKNKGIKNGDYNSLNKMLGVKSYERRKNAFNKEKKNASCGIL